MKIRNLNQKLKIKTELKKIGKRRLKNLSEEHYRKMGEIVINVIHILAQQITRGSLLITSIYREATKDPFSIPIYQSYTISSNGGQVFITFIG